jgi:hypothetical protein
MAASPWHISVLCQEGTRMCAKPVRGDPCRRTERDRPRDQHDRRRRGVTVADHGGFGSVRCCRRRAAECESDTDAAASGEAPGLLGAHHLDGTRQRHSSRTALLRRGPVAVRRAPRHGRSRSRTSRAKVQVRVARQPTSQPERTSAPALRQAESGARCVDDRHYPGGGRPEPGWPRQRVTCPE